MARSKILSSLIFALLLGVDCFALDPVDIAASQIGKPYVWGAVGPDSFDCSGLTLYAFQQAGVTIPRTSLLQSTIGVQVQGQPQRGDLLFFSTDDTQPGVVTHVGIYEGNSRMIDANSYANQVTQEDISSNYWSTRFLVARRVSSTTFNLNDNFDDNSLNSNLWNVLTPSPGTLFTVSEVNQRLEVALGPGFGGAGIVSVCQFTGDFDVQVDYILLNWPATNLHSARLGAPDLGEGPGGGIGLNRSSFSNGGTGEFYLISLPSSDPQIPAGQKFGKLRLVRSGSTMSGRILDGNATTWTLVGSGLVSATATHISLDLGAGSSSAQGGVSAAFDNFIVNSGAFVCP